MFRVLTENKNKSHIEAELIGRGLDFTIFEAEGTWKGKREKSLVIEFIGEKEVKVFQAAESIRQMNDQESVYIQEIKSEMVELTSKGVGWTIEV